MLIAFQTTLWTLSNIVYGNQGHKQAVMDANLMPLIISHLEKKVNFNANTITVDSCIFYKLQCFYRNVNVQEKPYQ